MATFLSMSSPGAYFQDETALSKLWSNTFEGLGARISMWDTSPSLLIRNLIFTSPSMPMRLARCGNGLQAHVYGLPEVISIARQLQEDGDKDLVGFHPY